MSYVPCGDGDGVIVISTF